MTRSSQTGLAVLLLVGWVSANGGATSALGAVPIRFMKADISTTESVYSEATRPLLTSIRKAEPDILILAGLTDWRIANDLARAVGTPDYRVAVCTSFPGSSKASIPKQTAILTKHTAFFSWTESWETNPSHGFGFAAISLGNRKIGCFVVCCPAAGTSTTEPDQLLAHLRTVRNWVSNRPELLLVAGDFGEQTSSHDVWGEALQTDGFIESDHKSISGVAYQQGSLFTRDRIFCDARQSQVAVQFEHDRKLGPAFLSFALKDRMAAPVVTWPKVEVIDSVPGVAPSQIATIPQKTQEVATADSGVEPPALVRHLSVEPWLLMGAGTLFCVSALVFLGSLRKKRRRRHCKNAVTKSAYVVVTPSSVSSGHTQPPPFALVQPEPDPVTHTETRAPSLSHATAETLPQDLRPQVLSWLKEKLIRKLLLDRSRLIDTQDELTRRTLNVTERITRIERQLDQQNQAYQVQIEGLTRELNATREENRELLRGRIAQAKMEMEAARSRLIASLNDSENQQG